MRKIAFPKPRGPSRHRDTTTSSREQRRRGARPRSPRRRGAHQRNPSARPRAGETIASAERKNTATATPGTLAEAELAQDPDGEPARGKTGSNPAVATATARSTAGRPDPRFSADPYALDDAFVAPKHSLQNITTTTRESIAKINHARYRPSARSGALRSGSIRRVAARQRAESAV